MDTKLHEAVRYGDVTDVVKALNQGYDPNLIGLYEWSPVHEASHNGESEILKYLLRHRGDPNQCDNLCGNTAVHYAAEEDHLDCLKLLLEVGGRPQLCNRVNQSAFDVASGGCKHFLEHFAMDTSSSNSVEMEEGEAKDDHNNNMDTREDNEKGERRRSSTGVHRWKSKEDFPAMGHLHLSFEYHNHKGSLKIRVWQVSDLLLPPPHTSMINTIFVRSYLIPDKPKKTNRKTEDVKVAPSEAHIATNRSSDEPGIQYIFTPSNFHFSMPLIYTGVTKEIVEERSIQIEVCMTQRYTKRIFLIAMINLPLKVAVKKLLREKYPLIPCMNYTIPNNMRVYSASELQLESNLGIFYSSPLLRDLGKSDSLSVTQTSRSASDVELQGITIHKDEQVSSVSINMDSGSHDFNPDLHTIKAKRKIVPDFTSIDIPHTDQVLPGQLEEVRVESDEKEDKSLCVLNMESKQKLKKIKPPKFNKDMEIEMESVPKLKHYSGHEDGVCSWDVNGIGETSVNSPAHSRPETPVWDYYDFDDFELGMEPVCDPTDTSPVSEDSKMDYKGVNLSQSAIKAMTGQSESKIKDSAQPRMYIPAIIVDDIENEDV